MQINCILWVKCLCMFVKAFPLFVAISVGVVTQQAHYYTYDAEHLS